MSKLPKQAIPMKEIQMANEYKIIPNIKEIQIKKIVHYF